MQNTKNSFPHILHTHTRHYCNERAKNWLSLNFVITYIFQQEDALCQEQAVIIMTNNPKNIVKNLTKLRKKTKQQKLFSVFSFFP